MQPVAKKCRHLQRHAGHALLATRDTCDCIQYGSAYSMVQHTVWFRHVIAYSVVQTRDCILCGSDMCKYVQGLLELSDEQVADLMHLRKLYLMKRGQLALQRKALVTSLACCDDQLVHPSDNSATAVEVAARLKDIAFEDQAVLYRIARTVWVGVRLSTCCAST